MHIEVVFLILGLVGLWFGAGIVVESAKKIAKSLGISQTMIGLTVIAIGTSLPEISTNVLSGLKTAAGHEASGIAVGTNIGSCLTQITLILGFIALIGSLKANRKIIRRDGGMVLVAITAFFLAGLDGRISQLEGVLLIAGYIVYLYFVSKDEQILKKITEVSNHRHATGKNMMHEIKNTLFIIAGLGLLIYSSTFVVENAVRLAEIWDVSQSFVGVMIIGVGTALPELSTALRGILKDAHAISLGTLLGSNVTDPMFSLGAGAVITGFSVERNLMLFDIPFWFVASIIALVLIGKRMRIGKEERKQGTLMMSLYVLFLFLKVKFFL